MTDIEQAAARRSRAEYYREWRRKHPEAVKAAQERYWLKRAKKFLNEKQKEGKDGLNAES